jgi:hypothetical protein
MTDPNSTSSDILSDGPVKDILRPENDWKWQTSQGYIIRILQLFATKLWNITNFAMFFQAVMKFLFRLVETKILEKW